MKFNDEAVFITAEISANHGQDFDKAVELIETAADCNVDAVKFQAYTPDTLTINVDNEYFRIKHPVWGGQTLYELYEKAYTPWKWFKKLKDTALQNGLIFYATCYDKSSVDFLEELDVPFHKISSFELIDLELVAYAAKTGKPLILSTGMASKKEIRDAVDTARKNSAKDITLLKCVSSYPARPDEMNLKTLLDMKERFKCRVGISDHTLNNQVSLAALALGAKMIEKHFTLSRRTPTCDNFYSIGPSEMRKLGEEARIVEKALGKISYGMTEDEEKNRFFRRSLFAVKDVKKGQSFTRKNIKSIRPSHGLNLDELENVLGKQSLVDIEKGTPLTKKMVDY